MQQTFKASVLKGWEAGKKEHYVLKIFGTTATIFFVLGCIRFVAGLRAFDIAGESFGVLFLIYTFTIWSIKSLEYYGALTITKDAVRFTGKRFAKDKQYTITIPKDMIQKITISIPLWSGGPKSRNGIIWVRFFQTKGPIFRCSVHPLRLITQRVDDRARVARCIADTARSAGYMVEEV